MMHGFGVPKWTPTRVPRVMCAITHAWNVDLPTPPRPGVSVSSPAGMRSRPGPTYGPRFDRRQWCQPDRAPAYLLELDGLEVGEAVVGCDVVGSVFAGLGLHELDRLCFAAELVAHQLRPFLTVVVTINDRDDIAVVQRRRVDLVEVQRALRRRGGDAADRLDRMDILFTFDQVDRRTVLGCLDLL